MKAPPIHKSRVVAHYEAAWGRSRREVEFNKGPIHELPAGFVILEFAPRQGRAMWTYATCCMSQESDKLPLELHMFSAEESEEPVELLVATAHYHRTGSSLGLGHSVNFGKPWIDESRCDHGLISLPYLDGPKVENMILAGGKIVKFYWMVPVTRTEVEYKKANGLESLERKFEAAKFNYVDPHRPSVC